MTQLIRKGGFRERANRSARFTNSENQQTVLSTSMRQYLSAQDDTDVNATIAAVAETITEKSNSTNMAGTTHTKSCESSTQPYTTNKGGK